jgi:A/G-specific adenine glycosylase
MSQPAFNEIDWFRKRLLDWYKVNGRQYPWRNKVAGCYQKIIAEILLQRTRADTIAIFYRKFTKRFPSWRKLSLATEGEMQEALQPIGLWRQRGSSLKKLADEITKRGGRFPRKREEIESLPGVGQYIANAILLFCHGESQPLLDINMARVLERFFGPRKLADIRYDPYLQSLAANIVTESNPILINWAILDHAALVCKHIPLCEICPVVYRCKFAQENKRVPIMLELLD